MTLLRWLAQFWRDYFIPGYKNTPRPPAHADGPTPYLEIVVTVYDKGQDGAGRTVFDIQHDAISFRDQRAEDFAFIRYILTLLAGSLPVTMPANVQAMRRPPALDPEPIPMEIA